MKSFTRVLAPLAGLLAALLCPIAPVSGAEGWHDLCARSIIREDANGFGFRETADLKSACVRAGLPVLVAPQEEDGLRLLPLDVTGARIVLDSSTALSLGRLAQARIHPMSRDARCGRFAEHWKTLNIDCPFPSMFDIDQDRLLEAGLLLRPLVDRGIPYQLTISGRGTITGAQDGDRVFSRSLTFDGFTGDLRLEQIVVEGDLVIVNSSVDSLLLNAVDISGRLIIKTSNVNDFINNPNNAILHGGVKLDGVTGFGNCENAAALLAGVDASGPMLLAHCLGVRRP